ncbi:MAG: transcriptional repressor [Desulfovibrionaceae bacterium]|nr:transcriptional repressor [Desulfovibrionaceae bacterium]MBF0514523.1 transcriptional repressor [Desulfovibrionaceae bacterium]
MKDPVAVFSDYVAQKGLKMTPQRRLILDVFLRERGHMASEELYNKVKAVNKAVGQATVYRTLKLLSGSGLAKEFDFGDGVSRYEQTYGHSHHDHLICERCGKNVEVVDQGIEVIQERVAREHGFSLTGHVMHLYGVCADCSRSA